MNFKHKKKKALVIVGAGASIEFGVPGTVALGKHIENEILNNKFCQNTGGVDAYLEVKQKLINYYGGKEDEAHFERIYHVINILDELHLRGERAVPKYRPVLYPFVQIKKYEQFALSSCCDKIIDAIYEEVSTCSRNPKISTDPFSKFFLKLEENFIPRVYTTNYDDLILQSTKDYSTGFVEQQNENFRIFSPEHFWRSGDEPGLFHLHGSVHMGFPVFETGTEIEEIAWYDSCHEALKYKNFCGSTENKMDGTGTKRTAIITGLDKLSSIQQAPFSFYYAGLSKDVVEADIIYILGAGMGDLHLNSLLKAARKANPKLPIIYVGKWSSADYFYSDYCFDLSDLVISLIHDLHIFCRSTSRLKEMDINKNGWAVDVNDAGAIWINGFQEFLNQPEEIMQETLKAIRGA